MADSLQATGRSIQETTDLRLPPDRSPLLPISAETGPSVGSWIDAHHVLAGLLGMGIVGLIVTIPAVAQAVAWFGPVAAMVGIVVGGESGAVGLWSRAGLSQSVALLALLATLVAVTLGAR